MGHPRLTDVVSHWDHLFEDLQQSSQDFYDRLEAALERRNLPEATYSRVELAQGNVLTGKRIYLRARRKEYVFDVCGAPFGNGFFVSWWLSEPRRWWRYILAPLLILLITGFIVQSFGAWPAILFFVAAVIVVLVLLPRQTYYRIDTQLMFQHSVHSAVLEVLDEITKAKGVRSLSEAERKPIMKDFLRGRRPMLTALLRG